MSKTIRAQPTVRLASKPRANNTNHHLTNNNGTWWCQITVHDGPFSRRLRFSLETPDLERARELRDRVFDRLVPKGGREEYLKGAKL